MEVFRLWINSIEVTDYLKEEFREFVQRAEGSSLWDFWLDNLTAVFGMDVLPALGVTHLTSETLRMTTCELRYYEKTVMKGFVDKVRIDPHVDSAEVEIDLVSNAWVLCKTSLTYPSNPFQTSNTEEGDSISEIIRKAIQRVFNMPGIRLRPFPTLNVIDDVDFIQYKTAILNIVDSHLWKYRGIYKITQTEHRLCGKVGILSYVDNFHYNDSDLVERNFLILGESGFVEETKITCLIAAGNLYANKGSSGSEPTLMGISMHDDYDKEMLKSDIHSYNGWGSDKFEVSAIKFIYKYNDNILYALVKEIPYENSFRDILYRICISDSDRFRYSYDIATFGQVLKDLAKMSDSIVWITPDSKIIMKDRSEVETLPVIDESDLIGYHSEVLSYDAKFSIPKAYEVLNKAPYDVESEVINYYDSLLSGEFKRHTAKILKDRLISEDRLVLKRLPVRLDGELVDCGIVKEARYEEDLITLITEKRL